MINSNKQAFEILEFTTDKELSRYKHLTSCFSFASELLNDVTISDDIKNKILNTILLHDIGYSEKIKVTGEHSIDGYTYLNENYPDLCFSKAILLHSDKINQVSNNYLQLVEKAYDSLSEIEFITLILLDYCDTHVSAYGDECTIDERWSDLKDRYANDPKTLKSINETYEYAIHIESIANYILDKLNSMNL